MRSINERGIRRVKSFLALRSVNSFFFAFIFKRRRSLLGSVIISVSCVN